MTHSQETYLARRLKAVDEPEDIGSASHLQYFLLDLASTLDDWPARNSVFRHRLDQVAHEIVRLAKTPPIREA